MRPNLGLTKNEKLAYELRMSGKTFADIGAALKLTRERARQIYCKAVRKNHKRINLTDNN